MPLGEYREDNKIVLSHSGQKRKFTSDSIQHFLSSFDETC